MDNRFNKEFIEYLMYVGIVNKDSIQALISYYNNSIDNDIVDSNEEYSVLLDALTNFLLNMNETAIKGMVRNIIFKYLDNQKKTKDKYLQTLIYHIHFKRTKQWFSKWQKQIKYSGMVKSPSSQIKSSQKDQPLYNVFQGNFINRQEQFNKKKKMNYQKITNRNEKTLLSECTFSPKIISTKKRMSPTIKKKKEFVKLFNNHQHEKYKKKLNDTNNKSKTSLTNSSSVLNKKTFDKLYNNAKDLESKKKSLQQQLDEERGITFKPTLLAKDTRSESLTRFVERNQKCNNDTQKVALSINDSRQYKKNNLISYKKYNSETREQFN